MGNQDAKLSIILVYANKIAFLCKKINHFF